MAYRNFINQGLTGDLLDVGKYYGDTNGCNLKSKNAFWVAEMITKGGEATIVGGIGFGMVIFKSRNGLSQLTVHLIFSNRGQSRSDNWIN